MKSLLETDLGLFATVAFGVGFGVSLLLLKGLLALPYFQRKISRQEKGRSSRNTLSFRLGGAALILGFLLVIFFDHRIILSSGLWGLVLGSASILLFGLMDDHRPLPWWVQLVFQVALGALLVSFGLRIELMQGLFGGSFDLRSAWIPGLPIVALFPWLILIMNAVNWLDGLDGLLGSVTFIGFLTLFAVSLFPEVHQPALSLLSLTLAGGSFAFLLFNWHPARLIAGTSGAYFLGFALATLSVVAGAKVATALLVLSLPILDALWVLYERFRSGVSLFLPDNRHLHYRLLELGWTVPQVSLAYTAVTLCMAILALHTQAFGKVVVFSLAALTILIFCVSVSFLVHKKQVEQS
ncbi:MAG: MraY family glycosyltransferase [Candidatus Moraniibacteriota bacterium]